MGNSIYGFLSRYFRQWNKLGAGLRDNLPANANRFLLGVVEISRGGVDDLSMDLVCPSTIVSKNIGCDLNIAHGHIDTLPVIQSLDRSQ